MCSRTADYRTQLPHLQLQLRNAVVVQPLTPEQIDAYLSSSGAQLEAVCVMLRNDPALQELATSPLMLSVLTLAYAGKSVEAIQGTGAPTTRRQVFADYVERMLHRRKGNPRYNPQQTILWLTWLARQLQLHSQPEFYLERMQPDWLEEHQSLRRFYRAAVRVSTGLLCGLVFGLVVGLVVGLVDRLRSVGLVVRLVVGLVGRAGRWVGRWAYSPGEREIKPAEVVIWSWKSMWQKLAKMES